jgi:hypothetical protein
VYDAEKPAASERGLHGALQFIAERASLRFGRTDRHLNMPYETIQQILTLLSYRRFILVWAIDPYDHAARKAPLSASDFPIPEIDVPRPYAGRCMGVLEVPWTRRCIARSGHEHGRPVHRDTRGKGRRRAGKVAFSGARRTNSSRSRGEAHTVRQRIRLEIHGPE